jgi:hypothetical protein
MTEVKGKRTEEYKGPEKQGKPEEIGSRASQERLISTAHYPQDHIKIKHDAYIIANRYEHDSLIMIERSSN